MGCLHDLANVQQTPSKCIQNTRANAGRLLDRVNNLLGGIAAAQVILLTARAYTFSRLLFVGQICAFCLNRLTDLNGTWQTPFGIQERILLGEISSHRKKKEIFWRLNAQRKLAVAYSLFTRWQN